MSAKADRAKLNAGAAKIRDAEGEARESKAVKLDGKLPSVVKEITRLYGEIEAARDEILTVFKLTLPKAIRIGELLTRIRASRKGKWVEWIADHLPFSRSSAY